jgi:hypothetical protein
MTDHVVPHAKIAAKYGKPLLTYESGPAITAGSGDFTVQVGCSCLGEGRVRGVGEGGSVTQSGQASSMHTTCSS